MARRFKLNTTWPAMRRVGRHFWPYVGAERRLLVESMAALLAGVALRLLEPWPLKVVFDRVLVAPGEKRRAGLAFLDALEPLPLLTVAAGAVIVFTGLRALADYRNKVGFALIGNRVLTRVRDELYRHLQRLSLSFHSRARMGDLAVRVTRDVNMLRDVTVSAALPLAAGVLVLAGTWAVMFLMQWRLALLATAVLPAIWLTTARLGRRIHAAARKQREREGDMAATAAESMSAIKTVQALSLEEVFADGFSSRSQQSQKQDVKANKLSASLNRTVDILLAIITALVVWYGARLVLREKLTPGDLLVFLAYLRYGFRPLQDFAKYTNRLAKATAAGERVVDLLERTPEVCDRPDAVTAPAFRGAVRFEHVSFAYEPEQFVFEDVDVEIAPGQRVAVVGPSGIGKSTLVSLLPRLYDPPTGRVLIDGRDIREFTLASLRAQISILLQENTLFAASIRDNIGYGAATVTPEQIEAAARLASAHEFIMTLPQGYDTMVAERGATLSAGQRQRIAIARAAIRHAPILIYDEPTTGLDEENERLVLAALERLAAGRTTFWITHDLRAGARADLILYLENGRILERGTHDELMQRNGRYATLYRLQTVMAEQRPERGDREVPHVVAG